MARRPGRGRKRPRPYCHDHGGGSKRGGRHCDSHARLRQWIRALGDVPEGTQLIWGNAVSIDAVPQVAPQLPRPMAVGLRPGYCLGLFPL